MTSEPSATTSATAGLRVRVRLFAIQRELAGTREIPLELSDDATVEDAWMAVVDRYPALAPGRPSVRFARNGDYADASTQLADGDEIAFIPPVSGGADAEPSGRELDPLQVGAGDRTQGDERRRILEIVGAAFPRTLLADL